MRKRRTDLEWVSILQEASRQGWDAAEVHRRTGAAIDTVRTRARDFGIVLPRKPQGLDIDWDLVLAKAVADEQTTMMVARQLQVHATTVWRAASRRGIRLGPITSPTRDLETWEHEFRRAADIGENPSALARRLGVSRQAVSLAAKRLNLSVPLPPAAKSRG